jgi:hypothetical protein
MFLGDIKEEEEEERASSSIWTLLLARWDKDIVKRPPS